MDECPLSSAMASGVVPFFRRRVDLRAVVQQQPRRVDVALKAGDE